MGPARSSPQPTMSLLNLTEASLCRQATAKSFERGESYYQSGSVVSLTQRGQVLRADVEGNEVHPYCVTLQFDSGGIKTVNCTCEYSFEGWCKHIVATVLTCIRQPEKIETRPTPDQLLAPLDPQQLRRILEKLMGDRPELIDTIDLLIAQQTEPTSAPPQQRQTTVDPAPFRRQVREIIRNGVNAWESGYDDDDPISEEILDLICTAKDFSHQGDGHNALIILETITEAILDNWEDAEDYGADNEEISTELDSAWTEAILSTELTAPEQRDLKGKLEGWQDHLDGDLEMSLEALRQGWDYSPLMRVFQGEITELGAWEDESPYYADDLALLRLQILERQDRYEEYLYLAQAEGQAKQYLTMLAQLGRVAEAMTEATTQMGTKEEAFALAKTLREQGALPQALEIAHKGLSLEGHGAADLATWTSDLAEGLGDRTIALEARIQAFAAQPSLGDYQKAKELAKTEWLTIQPDLLKTLRESKQWGTSQAKVDIFLEEGLIQDAIFTVQGLDFYYSDLIHRVMDVAIQAKPEWVIENARVRAEDIINRGKADAYKHAANWLRKMRLAFLAAERQDDWAAYRTHLIQNHGRKYKLMGLLEQRDLK
jgi:uncharacterized Zn finger protein